jgi:hypothetical protein
VGNPNLIVGCFCGKQLRNGYQYETPEFRMGVHSHVNAHRRRGELCQWDKSMGRIVQTRELVAIPHGEIAKIRDFAYSIDEDRSGDALDNLLEECGFTIGRRGKRAS